MHTALALALLLSPLVQGAPLIETITEVAVTTEVVVQTHTLGVDSETSSSSLLLEETTTPETISSTPTPTTADIPTSTTPITTNTPALATTTSSIPTSTSSSTSTTSSSTSTSSTTPSSSNAETLLNAHNAKRALHGVPDLVWDDTLYAYAAQYAANYDCSGTLTHSGGPYGENLALGYTLEGAIDAWYAEGDNYDYGSCSVLNHFTAVVWKSSTHVGCATKQCNNAWGEYLICSYSPAGNVVGECSENVLPLV